MLSQNITWNVIVNAATYEVRKIPNPQELDGLQCMKYMKNTSVH